MEGKSHKSFLLNSEIHPVVQLGLRIATSASKSIIANNAPPVALAGRNFMHNHHTGTVQTQGVLPDGRENACPLSILFRTNQADK